MRILFLLLCLFSYQMLDAHGSYGSGIVAGLSHPVMGLDHLLAIFTMALYAKVNFKESAWLIIFSFVIAMVVGGLIGINGQLLPFVEWIISFSVILYGLVLGLNIRIPIKVFWLLGLVIGLTHGYAHGLEMPDTTTTFQYVPGFALGAIVISAFGEFVGRHLANDNIKIAHFAGGLAVGIGFMLLLA